MSESRYDEIMAGTNIEKNPELPAPKIVKTEGIASGQIEVPLSDDRPVPPPTPPKVKIKKEITIREADNGYILSVWAGAFKEEWVFNRLSKAIRAIVAFLTTTEE
jgi:hypothetical protein